MPWLEEPGSMAEHSDRPGNPDPVYALEEPGSMADSDSDSETDRFCSALDALCVRHCSEPSSPNSRDYCTEFCALVEEQTGRWQVPLPQLKVLRTALCSFTNATAAFPDDCQHMRYALSSLALSYFELMLFFSKEEFVEAPMKEILDSFQECHLRLLRHRNLYFAAVRQTIRAGGPWESPVLQGIMRATSLTQTQVDEYLSSEVPVFLELRVRYLQACERVQEAMALTKTCLEHSKAGKHHYFHQAYLICLYKASLHEHLHKEYHVYLNAHMAELDGRDAVEIICNTESVEKGDVLLAMSKAFLNQQLLNGDMYYIWDLVFIWSRLHLRAHPSRQDFLADCRRMASSASNVRAIFPFIKVVTAELGQEGVQLCVELCAHALQRCDLQADPVTYSLVCKTVAFLLPGDQEVCRAAALLVFCQERSLEAYRTVCALHQRPDEELHPYISPIPTNARFHVLQILKEGLCFDPEFWNLLTIRTHCLELFSDTALKAAVLSEMEAEEEEEEEHEEEEEMLLAEQQQRPSVEPSCPLRSRRSTQTTTTSLRSHAAPVRVRTTKPLSAEHHRTVKNASESSGAPPPPPRLKRKRQMKKTLPVPPSDDEAEEDVSEDDPEEEVKFYGVEYDPEIKFYGAQFKATTNNNSQYSLRRKKCSRTESSAAPPPVKLPPSRQREYLSRCVKNNILKRKGRKKRWLQGVPGSESGEQQGAGLTEAKVKVKVKVKGKKRGRKPLQRYELSYPENEVTLDEEEDGGIVSDEMDTDGGGGGQDESGKENELEMNNNALGDDITHEKIKDHEEKRLDVVDERSAVGGHVNQQPASHTTEVDLTFLREDLRPPPPSEPELPALTAKTESGPDDLSYGELAFELSGCPVELFHNYALNSKKPDDSDETLQPPPLSTKEEEEEAQHPQNGDTASLQEAEPPGDTVKGSHPQVKVKKSWKEKMLQSQRYAHVLHHCILCQKDFKGLNVLRHALSHLKKNKLRCILCGKWFRQLPFAKKHIMDHMDTMSVSEDNPDNPSGTDSKGKLDGKDKPSKKNAEKLDDDGKRRKEDGEPDVEVTPVNGTETDSGENVNQDGDDEDRRQPPSPSSQQQPKKSKKNDVKTKAPRPELSRESRIIRNLRTNIRKLHRNGNTADFTDEQVVISEDLVMVTVRERDHGGAPPLTERAGAEEDEVKEKLEGEEEEVKEKLEGAEVKVKRPGETERAGAEELKEKLEGAEEEVKRPGETERAGAQEEEVKDKLEGAEREEVKKKRGAGENGWNGGFSIKYNLCPSELCDKLFTKLGPTMRHALKYHANEDRVLEKTFVWSNHKCLTCQRKMQFLQQYKDHMKLHSVTPPLRHFCVHVACSERFLTQQELKDHAATSHDPFRPQCCYAGCEQQFSLLQSLYDHEWRHYTPAPQKEEMMAMIGPNRHRKTQSDEAPWKQRVKIEEIWMQGGGGKGVGPKGHYPPEVSKSGMETEESEAQGQQGAATVSDPSGADQNVMHNVAAVAATPPVEVDVSKTTTDVETTTLFNGHVVEGKGYHQISEIGEIAGAASSSSNVLLVKAAPSAPHKTTPTQGEPGLDVKEPGESVTVKADSLEEMRSAKIRSFKADDPANTYHVKAPMSRPPPSAYMNEKELSMRKRRHAEENAPSTRANAHTYKKNWNSKKTQAANKKASEEEAAPPPPAVPTRSRCNRCLAIFSSLEEMKKHEALNTCSALFGFDSDDES